LGEGLEQDSPNIVEAAVMSGVNKLIEKFRDGPPNAGFIPELERSIDSAIGDIEEHINPVVHRLVASWLSSPAGDPNEDERTVAQNIAGLPDDQSRWRYLANQMRARAEVNARSLLRGSHPMDQPSTNVMDVLGRIETSERRVGIRQGVGAGEIPGVAGYKVEKGEVMAIRPGRAGDLIPISLLALGGPNPSVRILVGDPAWADIVRAIKRFFGSDYQPGTGRIYLVPREQVGTGWRPTRGREAAYLVVDDALETAQRLREEANRVYREAQLMQRGLLPAIRPANILGSTATQDLLDLPPTTGPWEVQDTVEPDESEASSDPVEFHRLERIKREEGQGQRRSVASRLTGALRGAKENWQESAARRQERKAEERVRQEHSRLLGMRQQALQEAADKGLINPRTCLPLEGCSYWRRYEKLTRNIDELGGTPSHH
jgi:hypothetical protein